MASPSVERTKRIRAYYLIKTGGAPKRCADYSFQMFAEGRTPGKGTPDELSGGEPPEPLSATGRGRACPWKSSPLRGILRPADEEILYCYRVMS